MKSGNTASALLFVVVACLLALAACQDRSPGPTAAAGTAEGKKMAERDPAKRAALAEASLAARVKAALSADPALNALNVDVSVSGNTVTLVGKADNPQHRDKASRIALRVQGVDSVENHLTVARDS